jgi:hypothetical protein
MGLLSVARWCGQCLCVLGRMQCTAVWHCRIVLAAGWICLCSDSQHLCLLLAAQHTTCVLLRPLQVGLVLSLEATAGHCGAPCRSQPFDVEGPMLEGGIKQWRTAADALPLPWLPWQVLSAAVPLSCCRDAYSCAADTTALLLQVAGLGRTENGAPLSSHRVCAAI